MSHPSRRSTSSSRPTHQSANTETTPDLIPRNSILPLPHPSHPHRYLPNPSTYAPHHPTQEDKRGLFGFPGEREAHPQPIPAPPAALQIHLDNQDLIAHLVPKLDRNREIASKDISDKCNLWIDSREPRHEIKSREVLLHDEEEDETFFWIGGEWICYSESGMELHIYDPVCSLTSDVDLRPEFERWRRGHGEREGNVHSLSRRKARMYGIVDRRNRSMERW
ncbi:hypothetical protein JCM5353_002096 [Sporobolomyces roseus]